MIETFPISIPALENERMVRVYLPKGYYGSGKRYPVLYMHDGKNVFESDEQNEGHSLDLKECLEKEQIEIIVVAIEQNSEERRNEYCPWPNGEYSKYLLDDQNLSFGGKGHGYSEFLVHELKPHIDKFYRTRPDSATMAGISLGGLITVYTAFRYPHIFKDIVIFSSGFHANWEEIKKLAAAADLTPINSWYMDCGTNEGESPFVQKGFLENNRSFYAIVKEKLPQARFKVIEGGEHHYAAFKKRRMELFAYLD